MQVGKNGPLYASREEWTYCMQVEKNGPIVCK